jgi:streptogramin lyase
MGDVNLGAIEIATTGGSVSQVAMPSGDKVSYDGMTLGPDGNVWVTENAHVGRIKPSGSVSEFAYSDGTLGNNLGDIVTGPDGNLWATEYSTASIDKITPATGAMSNHALGCNPSRIVSAGGSLWVSCTSNNLVQVDTSGTVLNQYFNGFGFPSSGNFMTVGADGNPWFGTATGNIIGTFDTTNLTLTYYYPPNNFGTTNSIALAPDGNMWTVDSTSRAINIYIINIIAVTPPTLNFPSNGTTKTVVVTEPGTSAWTAKSNNTGIATVAQGSPASNFKVTSVSTGSTKIIISDAKGNSFAVHVTVQ